MIIFTERDSRFLYEVKLFDDHVLICPLSRNTVCPVEKLSYTEFETRFEEFCGDRTKVEELLSDDLITETD